MAWVVAAKPAGGHCSVILASIRIRVASVHESSSCQEKWDSKWKSTVYGYLDADAQRKRHRQYVKRQNRAAGKRALLQWRSVEMQADDYRESDGNGSLVGNGSAPLEQSPAKSVQNYIRRQSLIGFRSPCLLKLLPQHCNTSYMLMIRVPIPSELTRGSQECYQWIAPSSQERRRQKMESAQKPQTPPSSGYSRRFENEWRAFEKKFRGRYDYYTKQQSYTRSEKAADSEDPTSGATGAERGHGESESARYRRHFWSNTWRGFGVGSDCDHGANSRWQIPHQARTSQSVNIGSPSDRSVLGLSPAGPLSLEELKLAFRQCALTWHPDRHDGDQKLLAEAKFKRVGNAYRTLRELLSATEPNLF